MQQPLPALWLQAVWALLLPTAAAGAAKQQLFPDQWAVLGPHAVEGLLGSWSDPLEALHKAGIHEIWVRKGGEHSDSGRSALPTVQPDTDGNVALRLRAGEQAWLVGQFKAQKSRCYSARLSGEGVLQALLGDRILPLGWPLQLSLPKGHTSVYVRVYGDGHFHFKLAPCQQKLKILQDSEETPQPDIVRGAIAGVVHVRLHNANSHWVRGLALRAPAELNEHVRPSLKQPPSASLAPGQTRPLSLQLSLLPSHPTIACPLTVRLRLEAQSGLEQPVNLSLQLRCRDATRESYTFTYLDRDGSPQAAGVRAPTESCRPQGCPVIMSLHGMDVPSSRQAYAYNSKPHAWVLAPHGRSAYAGLNWQGRGRLSAWAALTALGEYSLSVGEGSWVADVSRVVFTGHSNGGYGALLLAAEQPELALGVAPLAGMLRMRAGRLGGTRGGRKLRHLLEASVAAYDMEWAAGNVAGVPCLARTGAEDEVINPASTQQLVQAVRAGGGTCAAVEVPGKGHWWWDTATPNDGGAVDDAELAAFFERCLAKPVSRPPAQFSLRCASLDICGSRAGLRPLQQEEPFRPSSLSVVVAAGGAWEVKTQNILVLGLASPALDTGLRLDGQMLTFEHLRGVHSACRRPGSARWHLCPSGARCCTLQGRRTPQQAAPLRAAFEGRVAAVVGTGAGAEERHLDAAVALAGRLFEVGGGSLPILLDVEQDESEEEWENLLLLGGPDSNARTRHILQEGSLPDLRLGPNGEVMGLGPCNVSGKDYGLLAVGPLPNSTSGRFTLVAAPSSVPLARLLAAFTGLFQRNVWQVQLPDYLLLEGPGQGHRTPGGVLAAGYWGGATGWEWVEGRSYTACGRGRAEL